MKIKYMFFIISILTIIHTGYCQTTLNKGDLAILAVNTNIGKTSAKQGGRDQIAFVCFVDIAIGTEIFLTDNGYQRKYPNLWGSTEGVITITRTGSVLPAGTIVVLERNVSGSSANIENASHFDLFSCGVIDTNWTKDVLGGNPFNLNSNDDVWIMQGGAWNNVADHQSTYSGRVLYGWTESGWHTQPGGPTEGACTSNSAESGCTRWSTLYPGLECYNTVAPSGPGKVKFDDPINPDFSTTTNGRFDWIALINNTANWVSYNNNNGYNNNGYDYKGDTTCPALTIAGNTYTNGKWTGKVDTNWFNCSNWDTLEVPDENVDVQVGDNTFNNEASIDATETFADYYGNIAKSRNLTITGEFVEIYGDNTSNILEVHGDLLIDGPGGGLNMDDLDPTTVDGQLFLYGNWTNNQGAAAFSEGNGTVIFTGNTPQIISNVAPRGTEEFYNVIMNNDFDTSVSNDLYMYGSFVLNATKTLDVQASDYVRIQDDLTNDGTLEIRHEGSLVQVNDAGAVGGSGTTNVYKTTSNYVDYDYIYWSSPVQNETYANVLSASPQNWIFTFNTANFNDSTTDLDGHDDEDDDWDVATGNMTPGVGVIAMGEGSFSIPYATPLLFPLRTQSVIFSDNVNNGIYSIPTVQDNDLADNFMNQHLVGNPYPSAIDGRKFITDNASVMGNSIYLWTHQTSPSTAIPGNRVYNFTNNDYATINLSGGVAAASGGAIPSQYIASGQSFLVDVQDAPAGAGTPIVFNNAMRIVNENTHFLRTSSTAQQDRLWLNFGKTNTNLYRQILIAFFDTTTQGVDDKYDGERLDSGNSYDFYSLIENSSKHYAIQALPTFTEDQTIALGFESYEVADLSIGIDVLEGVFNTQDIFLEDKYLHVIHDLKQSDYTFTSTNTSGDLNDRFVLRFNNNVLNVAQEDLTTEALIVSETDNAGVHVHTSLNSKIKTIKGYDILGRLLVDMAPNATEVAIASSRFKTGTLMILKVQLEDDTVLIKKFIKL